MVHSALSASQNSRLLCEHMESLAVAIESAYEKPFGPLKVSADPARYRLPEAEPRERAPALRSRTASLTSSRRVNSRMRAAGAAACAPCAAGELLVGGEGEGGVEEAVHCFGYDAGGDFGIEDGEGGVGGGEEGEGGGEVVGTVGADEDAGAEEAEGGGGEAGHGEGTPAFDLPHYSLRFVLVVAALVQAASWVGRAGFVDLSVAGRYNYKGQREADGSGLEQKLSRAAQMGAGTPSAEGIISTLSSAPICCSGEQQFKAVWSSLEHTGFSLGLRPQR
ncbi:hypothetical protein R3P38DRAFT_3377582 [Favolaschia claudopus]|uniref:Uncharacterized protein n=1 Tax=Favolaschia claudopus TaxID=2862362 RepID=A0AAV9ZBJ8_9AGAR